MTPNRGNFYLWPNRIQEIGCLLQTQNNEYKGFCFCATLVSTQGLLLALWTGTSEGGLRRSYRASGIEPWPSSCVQGNYSIILLFHPQDKGFLNESHKALKEWLFSPRVASNYFPSPFTFFHCFINWNQCSDLNDFFERVKWKFFNIFLFVPTSDSQFASRHLGFNLC